MTSSKMKMSCQMLLICISISSPLTAPVPPTHNRAPPSSTLPLCAHMLLLHTARHTTCRMQAALWPLLHRSHATTSHVMLIHATPLPQQSGYTPSTAATQLPQLLPPQPHCCYHGGNTIRYKPTWFFETLCHTNIISEMQRCMQAPN
jgi:hypothetical protein